MKEEMVKRILWILTAVGIGLVAAALLGDEGAEKAGEETARHTAEESAKTWLALAGETVVMMKEKDGSWRVAGYFIR